MRLFVGDDWAEDHHDVEVMNEAGRVLAKKRLPEGVAGLARLHELIGQHLGEAEDAEVAVGIETDRGPWVAALVAAGYTVYPVNPLQASRYRERHGVSGAKSDQGDSHMLADMVRTDSHQLRPAAGDSPQAEAIKVVARTHKTLIWERTRHIQRLRHQLREYFPAALEAFEDLAAPDALELLAKMCPHLLFQRLDLLVQGTDHRDQRPGGGGVGGGQGRRLAQLGAAQRGQDRVGLAGDVAAAGALEHSGHLRPGQPGGPGPGQGPWPAAPAHQARRGPRSPPARRGSTPVAGGAAAGSAGSAPRSASYGSAPLP